MRIVQVAHHVSSCRPSSLGFKFSLLAVLTPICAYERGVSGGLMVQKEGKRGGNERNGSTDQPTTQIPPTTSPAAQKNDENRWRTIGNTSWVGSISYDNCSVCLLIHCVGCVEWWKIFTESWYLMALQFWQSGIFQMCNLSIHISFFAVLSNFLFVVVSYFLFAVVSYFHFAVVARSPVVIRCFTASGQNTLSAWANIFLSIKDFFILSQSISGQQKYFWATKIFQAAIIFLGNTVLASC